MRPDGTVVVLTDVRYMPTMRRNLISYGMLERSGCQYEGKDFMIRFYKDGKEIISGKFNEGIYYLQGTVSRGEANVSRAEIEKTTIWHSRLCHMS